MCKRKIVVSVIMPVYNGARYIKKGIQSVLEQTYKELELIIVNDGSRDNSKEIIEQIIRENSSDVDSIKYIEQENQGISCARNAGLKNACGQYIMFVDQDDTMETDCVEVLVNEAIESNAQLVIGGVNKVNEKGKVIERWSLDPQLSWSKFRITAPWGRVFKKSLIDEKKLLFLNTNISEDLYFNMLFLSKADNIKVISYVGYNWLQNQNSESHANWSRMSKDRNPLIMLTELHKEMGQSCLLEQSEMTFFFTKYLVWYLLFCSRGADKVQLEERSEAVFDWLGQYYPNFLKLTWRSIGFPKGEQFKIRFCVGMILLMYRVGVLHIFLQIYRKL